MENARNNLSLFRALLDICEGGREMSCDLNVLKENLEKKGYAVHLFDTKETAADYLAGQIQGKTVGIGGSATIHQMDLFPRLAAANTVYWHDEKPEGLTVMETRQAAFRAEVYLSSVNGISQQGEIVNIDYTGNRVAAISFGPAEVYLVIGANKVAPDLEAALYRARNVAAPRNAQRLNRKTPCAVRADRCYDCQSPDRICRNLSVLWTKPAGPRYEIILVQEELGY